jgi:predicted CxxxxCH...CXXCH cytochrome family protein
MTGMRNLGPARPWVYLLLFGVLVAAGCSTSTSNSGANLVDAQGKHPAGFLSTHPGLAVSDSTQCTLCHGSDLKGGIAKTSCFTTACHHDTIPTWVQAAVHGASAKRAPGASGFASCRICHGSDFSGGGAAVSCFACHRVNAPHPARPWRTAGGATHVNTDTANTPVCAACHFPGSPNNPAGHPPTPAPAGTPPGCFNSTLCHAGGAGANHAVPFVDNTHSQATQTTFNNDCSNCHAVTGTSPVSAAPLCTVCHTAGSPLTLTSCTSCHANPPNGAVSAYPNVAGAHGKHLALNRAGTPVTCNTCHNGQGSNTLNHYNRANGRPGAGGRIPPGDAAFLTAYNAKSGASSFDNATLSCSNVSCHGGQARSGGTPGTPINWQTGTLNKDTQCTSCHALGTAQFNSYNSGQHAQSSHVGFGCLVCHNPTTLAVNHFTTLGTTAMEGPASATIGGTGTGVTTYAPGATPGTGSCTPNPGCHNTRTW